MTIANNPDFWVVETNKNNNYYIRAYSVDGRYSDGNVTWTDINIPMIRVNTLTCQKAYCSTTVI